MCLNFLARFSNLFMSFLAYVVCASIHAYIKISCILLFPCQQPLAYIKYVFLLPVDHICANSSFFHSNVYLCLAFAKIFVFQNMLSHLLLRLYVNRNSHNSCPPHSNHPWLITLSGQSGMDKNSDRQSVIYLSRFCRAYKVCSCSYSRTRRYQRCALCLLFFWTTASFSSLSRFHSVSRQSVNSLSLSHRSASNSLDFARCSLTRLLARSLASSRTHTKPHYQCRVTLFGRGKNDVLSLGEHVLVQTSCLAAPSTHSLTEQRSRLTSIDSSRVFCLPARDAITLNTSLRHHKLKTLVF